MIAENAVPITEARLFAGFGTLSRAVLRFWKDRIIKFGDRATTFDTIAELSRRLRTENAVIFFDHHYAFDAIPASLTLGQNLKHITGALIPYAVHLNMGIDPEGMPAMTYWMRTTAFQWMVENVQKANPTIQLLPVVREFEMKNPRLRTIVERDYSGSNTKYLKTFSQLFEKHSSGQLCILSPMAGIAFPDRPSLHPQVYRSLELIQIRTKKQIPFYFVGAYPSFAAHINYMAPLLTQHTVVVHGPFHLPSRDYDTAFEEVTANLRALREAADFVEPDYSKIKHK